MANAKGMMTCKVCGREFALIAEEHYISRDPEETGLAAAFGRKMEGEQYDAFDCPHCGCQNVIQKRKIVVSELIISKEENEDTSDKESTCDGCEHDDDDPACNWPCTVCARTLTDYYKKKED